MDKNLISVDDLVRQRLGGGEEQERAGSWLRMRELLDQEMPQVKPVGFNWRRMFSAAALLLLISFAGIGGYELSTSYTKGGSDKVIADASAAGAVTISNTSNTAGEVTTDNHQASNDADQKSKTNEVNHTQLSTNTPSTAPSSVVATSSTSVKHTKTSVARNRTGASLIASNTGNNNQLQASDEDKTNSKSAISKKTTVQTEKEVASVTTSQNAVKKDAITTSNKSDRHNVTQTAKVTVAAPNGIETKANNAKTENDATVKTVAKSDDDNKLAATDRNSQKKVSNRHTTGKNPKMDELALNSSAPSSNNNVIATTPKLVTTDKRKTTSPHKLAVTGNAVAANKAATALNNETTTAGDPAANATAGKASRKTGRNSQQKVAAMPLGAVASNNAVTTVPVKHSMRKGYKQVQQLTISQRFIKTSPTTGYMHLDTISQETITQEYELAENNVIETAVFGPPPYDKPTEAPKSHTVVTINSTGRGRSNTTSTMENLSAAFNDVKNKVNGVHFAPGLTAGVNGTFFGPNSFKGFQFGVTGNFTFSDNLSIMSELKYVHRINNDYSLNDDYYTYTPNSAGGYTRELVVNPYSFSTLHSFELPVSLRFCIQHFNFFVGGNFVYTFAVNTGAYPIADPNTATQVSSVGTDNTPKLKADDFSARFGIGYLFGASYQVSPNVMIDLRSVQTFWDNASSSGSKIISRELYKSPSLQLSIGYRLGNDKNKNK